MRVAAIDAGTNTFRLLIRDSEGRAVLRKNFYLFLGSEVENGLLTVRGVARVRDALAEAGRLIRENGVSEIHAVATAFARKLKDPDALKLLFRELIGTDLAVISPETEGVLVLTAVEEQFSPDEFCIMDMGGGSTEFIFRQGAEVRIHSFEFGSLSLTKTFLGAPGLAEDREQALAGFVSGQVAGLKEALCSRKMFGVGGTATTLAFLISGEKVYSPELVNGRVITRLWLDRFYTSIRGLTAGEIRERYPLEQGREKVLAAGCLALASIMKSLGFDELTASDTSLLDGIISCSRKTVFSR